MLSFGFGLRERVKRLQITGHSASDNLNDYVTTSIFLVCGADAASLASPAHPDSLEIKCSTLAAVVCDAEEPCSVHTALEPESSFTVLPRNTRRRLYFWNFFVRS